MQKLGKIIESNWDIFNKLFKAGAVSVSVKQQYQIYMYFNSTSGTTSLTQRYTDTAEAMGVSERTVQRAVKEMKKVI